METVKSHEKVKRGNLLVPLLIAAVDIPIVSKVVAHHIASKV